MSETSSNSAVMSDSQCVLEITPYEPPSSGWVTRVKLLRRVINERGHVCEILDIGPNRRMQRADCISVFGAIDYLKKVRHYASGGSSVHCHINGEYFRGILLAIAAAGLAKLHRCRFVTTFHAGVDQPFFYGWRRYAVYPFLKAVMAMSDAIVCNSDAVAELLAAYANARRIHSIPAFSSQYLEFAETALPDPVQAFCNAKSSIISTYLCFRPGFYFDVFVDAISKLLQQRPDVGVVIVGTGGDPRDFCDSEKFDAIADNLIIAGDLSRDEFMSLLKLSKLHVRTPTSDGVSSTVLEALSLKIPVVASDNGTRPSGVVLYDPVDATSLATAISYTLDNATSIAGDIPETLVTDTAAEEVDLLLVEGS